MPRPKLHAHRRVFRVLAGFAALGSLAASPATFAADGPSRTDAVVLQENGASTAQSAKPAPPRLPAAVVHSKPKPLADGAVTSDWTRFLGPSNDCKSPEKPLLKEWPEAGPQLIWEMRTGEGYATPAVKGGRLVYFQRIGNEEVVQCLNAETGEQYWDYRYPTDYVDMYRYSGGPRCPPIIDGDLVFTYGAEGKLHCLRLQDGEVVWQRDLMSEYKLEQNFFGVGDTPLVEGNLLVLNLGAPQGPCVAAFDKRTGKLIWGAGDEWTPGYSSPIAATVHGKRRVFVFSGARSDPPVGGLMCVDPATGKLDFRFPWRSNSYESVNASPPVVVGDRVFVSASYRKGSAVLKIKPDFTYEVLWQRPDRGIPGQDLGVHWMAPVYKDGYLYAFSGRNEPDAMLACIELETGKLMWREVLLWPETFEYFGRKRTEQFSPFRASLLDVDGRFLCVGEWGHLLWLDLTPEGVKILDRAWLFQAPHTWGMPVVSRGLLYINQNERGLDDTQPRLLCYDLRAP